MKKCFSRGLKLSLAATLLFWAGGSPGQTSGSLDHPRLYFTRSQLPQLRKMREREEVRDLLSAIGKKYYDGYFTTPAIAGPGFHTHHATVEWSSFGITALALLNEVPDAKGWLEATVKKFEEHLLPSGLAADGA